MIFYCYKSLTSLYTPAFHFQCLKGKVKMVNKFGMFDYAGKDGPPGPVGPRGPAGKSGLSDLIHCFSEI